jgi:hypothetical protein
VSVRRLLAALLTVLPVCGQGTSVRSRGDDAQPPVLPPSNSSVRSIQGDFLPASAEDAAQGIVGVCIYKTPVLEFNNGVTALEMRGVGQPTVDSASNTCTVQFEVGQPQDAVLTWDRQHSLATPSDPTPIDPTSVVPAAPRVNLRYTTSSGYWYLSFVDPIGLTVNSNTVSPTWTWRLLGASVQQNALNNLPILG